MKHLTMADKSLLIGDEAADLLIAYAALIAQIQRGDHVTLHAVGADGNDVEATFLLNTGTVLVVETSTTTMTEPDNTEAAEYLRERLDAFGLGGAAAQHRFGVHGPTQDIDDGAEA